GRSMSSVFDDGSPAQPGQADGGHDDAGEKQPPPCRFAAPDRKQAGEHETAANGDQEECAPPGAQTQRPADADSGKHRADAWNDSRARRQPMDCSHAVPTENEWNQARWIEQRILPVNCNRQWIRPLRLGSRFTRLEATAHSRRDDAIEMHRVLDVLEFLHPEIL